MTDTSLIDDEDLFTPEENAGEVETPADEEGFEVLFEGEDETEEADDTKAAPWVKDLRIKNRELARRNAELEAKVSKPPEIGPKPTIDQFDFDQDQFDVAYDAWHAQKTQAEQVQTAAQREEQAQQQQLQTDLNRLREAETALRAPDYAAARDDVSASLNDVQQAIIITVAKDAAKVIYALGKRPERLAQIAQITNPLKLAAAIADLERGMKVTTRRTALEPESRVRGSAPLAKPGASAVEKQYEKLLENGTPDQRKEYRQKHGLGTDGKALPKAR